MQTFTGHPVPIPPVAYTVTAYDEASRQEVFTRPMHAPPRLGDLVQIEQSGAVKRYEVRQVLWRLTLNSIAAADHVALAVREVAVKPGAFPGVDL